MSRRRHHSDAQHNQNTATEADQRQRQEQQADPESSIGPGIELTLNLDALVVGGEPGRQQIVDVIVRQAEASIAAIGDTGNFFQACFVQPRQNGVALLAA